MSGSAEGSASTRPGLVVVIVSLALCLFTLKEVNYPQLQQQSALALFVMLGLVLCFLQVPMFGKNRPGWTWAVDILLATATVFCCGYVIVQNEPVFQPWWIDGMSLGDRAGVESRWDLIVGAVGLLLVLEATRRTIGWIVPLLALAFVAHSLYCHLSLQWDWPVLPRWMLPHAGQSPRNLISTTFLQTLGVFGPAARVMFVYVFLFIVFGAFLEMAGATDFIIQFAQRLFGRSPGGPAKVAVIGSGLMGSLSGSAVANAVATGSFTIPMMRSAGFSPSVAGGITAAAASGGALVPPVMGAGAYMMLELVQPQVTFPQVALAAMLPAVLYYFSLFMIVHFYARRVGVQPQLSMANTSVAKLEGVIFFLALGVLVLLLALSMSPSRAVTAALVVILVLATLRRALPLSARDRAIALGSFLLAALAYLAWSLNHHIPQSFRRWVELGVNSSLAGLFALLVFALVARTWRNEVLQALVKAARGGVPLVAASACVGIIIGIVQETGIANDFSAAIKSVVQTQLLLALVGIMVCSIILGMGVPSVVCYLLMATLMGTLLQQLGVIPLAAHLFIFYFGMMSMVTPPVALAAYASAGLAQAPIMKTAWAAFRFALVGFTLPFMFVFRPALLLMDGQKWSVWLQAAAERSPEADLLLSQAQQAWPSWTEVLLAFVAAAFGVVALAAAIAGYFRRQLSWPLRGLFLLAAALLLSPDWDVPWQPGGVNLGVWANAAGAVLLILLALVKPSAKTSPTAEESLPPARPAAPGSDDPPQRSPAP